MRRSTSSSRSGRRRARTCSSFPSTPFAPGSAGGRQPGERRTRSRRPSTTRRSPAEDPKHVTVLDAGAFVRSDTRAQYVWRMPCLPGGEPGCDDDGTVGVRYVDGLHFCTDPEFSGQGCRLRPVPGAASDAPRPRSRRHCCPCCRHGSNATDTYRSRGGFGSIPSAQASEQGPQQGPLPFLNDEGPDPGRRRRHPAAADHAHERQAARADRQQADPLLRDRGRWSPPGSRRSASSCGDTAGPRSRPRSATARRSASRSRTSPRTRRSGSRTACSSPATSSATTTS